MDKIMDNTMDILNPQTMFKIHRKIKQKQAKQAMYTWRTRTYTNKKAHALKCITTQTWYSV